MNKHDTIQQLLEGWDSGDTIWSMELGGLGPGYEQAIQIAAVEFARACKDLSGLKQNDKDSTERFTAKCDEALHKIDDALCGLSGAQFGAARWLAWQWVTKGPAKLMAELKERGEDDRAIQVSRTWPKPPEPARESLTS